MEGVVEELGQQYTLQAKLHFHRYLDTVSSFISLSLPLGSSILDIGCGYGHLCLAMKRLGYDTFGIDVNTEGAKRLQPHGIPFYTCDIEKDSLPIGSGTFDCVLLAEAIEHIDPRSLKHVLGEIHRVLKSPGVLLITTPNQAAIQNGIRLLLGKKIHSSQEHVREYTLSELIEVLQSSGFSKMFHKYMFAYDHIKGSTRDPIVKQPGYKLHDLGIIVAKSVLYPFKLAIPSYRSLILVSARKIIQK